MLDPRDSPKPAWYDPPEPKKPCPEPTCYNGFIFGLPCPLCTKTLGDAKVEAAEAKADEAREDNT